MLVRQRESALWSNGRGLNSRSSGGDFSQISFFPTFSLSGGFCWAGGISNLL